MASRKTIKIGYRRKESGKTNYKKRLALLKSKKPRLVVRVKNKNIYAQVIEYIPTGDKIAAAASSKELLKYGWTFSNSSIPAAYLLGLLIAKKSEVKEAIFDLGLQTPTKGSKVFAVLKGAIDGGLDIPHSVEKFPDDDRISGKHISDYAIKLKETDEVSYGKQFKDQDYKKFQEIFERIKADILNKGSEK